MLCTKMNAILNLVTQFGPYVLVLLAAVIMAVAIRLQVLVSQRFQFNVLTRWHGCAMLLLLTAPTISFFLYTTPCRSLGQLPLVPAVLVLLVIASVPLGLFNISRTNLKCGALVTSVQMCVFLLALTVGSVPAIVMEAVYSIGAGGMHACVPSRTQ